MKPQITLFIGLILLLSGMEVNSKPFGGLIKDFFKAQNGYDDIFPEKTEFGYIKISRFNSELFYWLCPARNNPDTAPLVIWLQGGPGCSSETGNLFENGPFYLKDSQATTATIRATAWNNNAHLLYIDQPVGTGFSVVKNHEDYAVDAESSTDEFMTFITGFYQKYPQFRGRDLYLTGESYAGKWIPYFSHKLYALKDPVFNLKGISIGNAFMTPSIIYSTYPKFAFSEKEKTLCDEACLNEYQPRAELCRIVADNPNPFHVIQRQEICTPIFGGIHQKGGFNVYNIDMHGQYPEYRAVFLNRQEVQKALDVKKHWYQCNMTVYGLMTKIDWWLDSSVYLHEMMDDPDFRVWWYNGDLDFICNWLGEYQATKAIPWKYQAQWDQLVLKDCDYGQMQELNNVRFIKFHGAGHFVPHDQSEIAAKMFNEFIGVTSTEDKKDTGTE